MEGRLGFSSARIISNPLKRAAKKHEMLKMIAITLILFAAPHWTMQSSGVTARLRGVSAVSERVAWASGAGSTVLRTVDGGVTWQKLNVTGEELDFRDIDAVDALTAY